MHLHNILLLFLLTPNTPDILEMSGCQSNGASQIATSSLRSLYLPVEIPVILMIPWLDLIQAGAASTPEPTSFRQSQQHFDADLWQKACEEEMEAHRLGTWEIVNSPPGKHAIGSRWFMKVKRNADGSLDHYKARRLPRVILCALALISRTLLLLLFATSPFALFLLWLPWKTLRFALWKFLMPISMALWRKRCT